MKLKREILEPSGKIKKSVIWLHGLGANGHDFVPIVPELQLPEDAGIRFIFPHAPERPVTLNNGYVMPAWYDLLSLDRSKTVEESDLLKTVDWITDLVDEQVASGIAPENIMLIGFSQGGVIALHTALRYPKPLAGIMALSTYFPFAEKTLKQVSDAHRKMPIFAAHGVQDPVVTIASWETYVPLLKADGFNVAAHSYPMEHSLCIEEIVDMRKWFKSVLL